jgi:murein DD-endopeptidase MepM/ murein hydrolase activator NlpD
MTEAVIDVEDLRRQEITAGIRNAIREMIEQAVEIAILDYQEEILTIVPEPISQQEPITPTQPQQPTKATTTTVELQYTAPLRRPVVSSPFGMRMHPIRRVMQNHNGIDFRASTGTPVYAVSCGVVFNARNESKGYGLVVRIRHENENVSLYAHLSRMDVKNGQRVNKGDVIGLVGSTGGSTGPHLHFGYRVNNIWVDPIDKIQ